MYKIISMIGAGSFGKVYLLQCSKYQFALKVEKEPNSKDDDNRGDVLLLRLRHAHLVRCWDAFLCGSNLYYVLELCHCGSLDNFLAQRIKSLSQERILAWFSQIADVIRYLHAMNVMHRDLKPANIFLDEGKNIKVGDLGIARKLEFTKEQVNTGIGTLCYMSPELHAGNFYDFKVDMWSLGCCIHEMMTLGKTFSGSNMLEVLHNITTVTIPEIPHVYDKGLRQVVLSLLSIDPSDRPDALEILFYISRISGKQLRSSSPRTAVSETFDHEQICKAVAQFESSSKNWKIVPLKGTVNDCMAEIFEQNEPAFQHGKDSSTLKRRKKKKLIALKNVTLKDESCAQSEVVDFKTRLANESLVWLQEQRKSRHKLKKPDDASEPCSVTLSTKLQCASFLNKKLFAETEKGNTNSLLPDNSLEEPPQQLTDITKSMMALCQGQNENLSEMMLMRVKGMGCHHFPGVR